MGMEVQGIFFGRIFQINVSRVSCLNKLSLLEYRSLSSEAGC